jgi:ABC transporter substrate binding protein
LFKCHGETCTFDVMVEEFGLATDPPVIASILHSCYRLAKLGMEDWIQWAIAAVCLVVTVTLQAEVALLFIGAGIVGILFTAGSDTCPSLRCRASLPRRRSPNSRPVLGREPFPFCIHHLGRSCRRRASPTRPLLTRLGHAWPIDAQHVAAWRRGRLRPGRRALMRRREFLTLLGGAAASWPLTTHAQQGRIPVIGYLHAVSPERQEPNLAAFRKALAGRGFVEGRNVAVEYRYAHNDYNRLPGLVADLVRRQVAVILALGGAVVTQAVKNANANIPIVFVQGDDPVATGLVASLNRPAGNVTGIAFLSTELGPKRLGLLKELVPAATRYALLVNPLSPTTDLIIADMRAAAASIDERSRCSPPAPSARLTRLSQCWCERAATPSWSAVARYSQLVVSSLQRLQRLTTSPRCTTPAQASKWAGS